MSVPNADLQRAAEILRGYSTQLMNPTEMLALASRLEAMSAPDNAALIAAIEEFRPGLNWDEVDAIKLRCRIALELQQKS